MGQDHHVLWPERISLLAGSDLHAQGLYAHQLDHGIINLTPSPLVISLSPLPANHLNGGEARLDLFFITPPALYTYSLGIYIASRLLASVSHDFV